jgi:chitin synthase
MPMYTVVLAVGTVLSKSALYRLLRSLERDPDIGCVCGEVKMRTPSLLNFVQASQHFASKVTNLMPLSNGSPTALSNGSL